jgi:hypothetical protein
MDGEQSIPINLASPLDINSHDMLVPVDAPKFTFNRQKYQGSLLQTSVRYEADGWFAGWWGHNFELVVDAEDTITPELGDPKQLSVIRRTDENNNKTYSIRHKDLGLSYTFNPVQWSSWHSGSGSIVRTDDTTVTITGTTNKENHFTATINPYTGVLATFSDVDNVDLRGTVYKEGANIRLEVTRNVETSLSDYIELRVNNAPILANIPLSSYSYDKGTGLSKWNEVCTLKVVSAASFTLVFTEPTFVIQGTPTLSGYGTADEAVSASVKDITVDHLVYSFQYKSYWVQDLFSTVVPQNDNMSQQVSALEHRISAELLEQGFSGLIHDNDCTYRLSLPIWIQHYLEFNYSVTFDDIGRPEALTDFIWVIAVRGDDEEAEFPVIEIPGFLDMLNTSGVMSLTSFMIPGPSAHSDAVEISPGVYHVVQPSNPRYSLLDINLSGQIVSNNLYIPQKFQPYIEDTNPNYDPRPVISAGTDEATQLYGLTSTGSKAYKYEKNPDKYDLAKAALSIAEIQDIPDGREITPFVPEYEHTSGTLGVDLIDNPFGYQPDPEEANYDPRPYVHAIFDTDGVTLIPDPDVEEWVDGKAAITNPDLDASWGATVLTTDYTRYWLRSTQLWQVDWNMDIDVGEFWALYWPTLPVPDLPVQRPDRASPYGPADISGVENAYIEITTLPDTSDLELQPRSAEGMPLPPANPPDKAQLTLGGFTKKSILHSIKNITDKVNWSWAFRLKRDMKYTTTRRTWDWSSFAYRSSVKAISLSPEYYDSNAELVSGNAPLVWKPMTENFPGMTIYDEVPTAQRNVSGLTLRKDTWVLYLKCKNGERQFPIPITDFNNPDLDGSNYFQLDLKSNGNFSLDQDLMNLFTSVYWTIPTYISNALYKDNYTVLNKLNLTRNGDSKDPKLLQGTNTKGILNIPLCVPGYAISRITTPHILNSNLTAFELSNNVVNSNTYMWRIDNRGAGYPYDLNLVKAELTSVQQSSSSLFITYQSTGVGPFYQLIKAPVSTDSTTEAITGYQDFSYPDWILRNLVPIEGATIGSYSENEYAKIFVPGTQAAPVTANVTVLIKELDFIDSVIAEHNYTATPYNRLLFETVHPSYSVTPPAIVVEGGVETHNQTVVLSPYAINYMYDTFTVIYNPDTTDLVGDPVIDYTHNWNYVDYETAGDTKKKVSSITVNIQSPEVYDLVFKRTLITRKAGLMIPVAGIEKQENRIVTLNPETYGLIDLAANKLYDSTLVSFTQNVVTNDVVRIYVTVNNSALVYFKTDGLISRSNGNIVYDITSTPEDLKFSYNDEVYTLHFDTRTNIKQYLSYTCTDIRTGALIEVYRRDLNDITMFIKQFWSNTVDVENFWWIDSEHVLELAKHTLTLYKKVGSVEGRQSVHDWNGDNWEVETVRNRSSVISSEDLYYSVSSAYNTSGLLFKFRPVGNKVQLQYIDVLATEKWDDPGEWNKIDIPVVKVPLLSGNAAQGLPHDSIGSYGPLNIDSLITTTKISSTTIKLQNGMRTLLVGIKQNNGLGQWCLKVDVESKTLLNVIIGYGCVGIKGELTGGQIPIDYCDASGFKGVVQELTTALPETVDKLESIPRLIVGTSSQQWFIQERMTGIISHLTFDVSLGTHVPVPLYLNSNVAVRKNFTTYEGARLQDVIPQVLNIATLIGSDNAALNILIGVISPSFFYLSIFYAVFVGIGTALGTYSYTWRNSNEIKVRGTENLTDQDKSFGKYEYNKALSINNKGMHAWAQIIVHMIGSELPETLAQVVVNKSQGQSAVDDSVGRKFSQLFEDSISSTVSTAIDSSGFNVRVQSTIKHQHSLTSFYSINDKIECHAGPGFVNHNLKAQCTAQSMQDIQFDGKQLGFFSVLTALTKLTLGVQNSVLQAAYDALERVHDNTAQQVSQTGGMVSFTINWGYFAALAISAGMAVTNSLIKLNNVILDNLDAIIEMLGGSTAAFLNNWLSAHTPTQEGLHTYGNKSMSFFWPAFGIDTPNTYTNEGVLAVLEPVKVAVSLAGALDLYIPTLDESDNDAPGLWIYPFEAGPFKSSDHPESASLPVIKCLGKIIPPDESDATKLTTPAPENMAVIEGTTSFLNQTPFKNEQIGVGPPVFGPPMIHDFMIDKTWALGYTAGAGAIISVSCDDTKLIDGPPSNIIITDDFCGIASSYIALEVKKTFDEIYLRPTMVTANAIGLNINRINCVHDAKAYHAFDGQVNRIVNWVGGQGMDKELLYQQYLFQMNDHFKRSNIFPPAQFFGSFQGPPVVAMRSYEIVSNTIIEQTSGLGFGTNTPGENRNLQRFSTCVFSELLSSLPTTIRTLAPYKLRVNDGVTCLVTELRNTNTRYKAPTSLDFTIGTRLYRKTEEYIVEISEQSGVVMTETRTPSAGLEFVGPTMTAAYFYSPATKLYYEYAGGTELQKRDILNRFKDVREGRWDFINQEVIFSVQHGYTDEEMILRLDQGIHGEVWPPNKTIYNERSGFKIYSCAGGLVYQGPKRFIVSRFVTLEHMIPDIKRNKRRWTRLDREQFVYERDYGWEYEDLYTATPITAVSGWTHNPFLLVTSMLGTDEEVDNKFEWTLTFAWSELLEHLLEQNEYVTVNVMAETVTQGGVLRQRPTHIFLSRDVFTRSDNAGYYTIKFQSNNGIGNRERLFIWSDGIVALEDIKVACKQMTSSRTQPLITQVDLERLVEL